MLVATDVASKGLDFPDIQHVINYDMPEDIENYGLLWFLQHLIVEHIWVKEKKESVYTHHQCHRFCTV